MHGLDRRVRLQERRDGRRVRAVRLHAPRQRRQAAHHEPAVEGRRHRAAEQLRGAQVGEGRVVVARDDRAAEHVAASAEVLRRRVHDHAAAELERPLQRRRREGVVGDGARAGLLRDGRHRRDVDALQQRIRRRLDPDDARLRLGASPRHAPRRGRSCRRRSHPPSTSRTGASGRWRCRGRCRSARRRGRPAAGPGTPRSRPRAPTRTPRTPRRPRARRARLRARGGSGCRCASRGSRADRSRRRRARRSSRAGSARRPRRWSGRRRGRHARRGFRNGAAWRVRSCDEDTHPWKGPMRRARVTE